MTETWKQLTTPQDWNNLAAAILATCKRLNPNFHNPNPQMTQAWALTLQHHAGLKPTTWPNLANAYLHGTMHWHANDTTGNRPTIGQIIQATKTILKDWTRDPNYKQTKQNMQLTAQNTRDQQLKNHKTGTLPAETDGNVSTRARISPNSALKAGLSGLGCVPAPEGAAAEFVGLRAI